LLREMKLVDQAAVRLRFLDRIQVLALDVLDERHLEQRALLSRSYFADDDRHALQAGEQGGPPTAFAGDDLESIIEPADDDRLDDAVRFDRPGELFEPGIVDMAARLELVRREPIDIDVK